MAGKTGRKTERCIDVSYNIDEEVTNSDLEDIDYPETVNYYPRPPHSPANAEGIENRFHDNDDSVYLFLSPSGAEGVGSNDWSEIEGTASSGGSGFPPFECYGMFVFEDDVDSSQPRVEYQKTVAHETGHILNVGTNDDSVTYLSQVVDEVYSGSTDETTPEEISLYNSDNSYNYTNARWSLMRRDTSSPFFDDPFSTDYTYDLQFSIEELVTIETANAVDETH